MVASSLFLSGDGGRSTAGHDFDELRTVFA
jgi:hypothetical protein